MEPPSSLALATPRGGRSADGPAKPAPWRGAWLTGAPTLVFSHANGFPAGTYRLLFEAWRAAGWQVLAVPKYGHDARYPVTNNWPHLRDQLIHFIEGEATAPVYLVGHSMGGYLSVLAASRRPELVRGVVLLDSPILGGLLAHSVRVAKATGLGARFSPGRVSMRRRHHWPSADAAHKHFAAKPAFARWAPEVLRDYIACGVQAGADTGIGTGTGTGVASHNLVFRREVETTIYDTVPHHITWLLRRYPLHCPMAFIGGTQSVESKQVGLRATTQLTHGRMSQVAGSHLFPFEKPDTAAAQVLHWLQDFASSSAN